MIHNINLKQLKYYLRLSPFDVRTEEGRAEERHRQIILTTLSSGSSKISAALISFALIPVSLNYLGVERFGLWMTISAAVAMLSIADMGIGSGLMNAVATAKGKEDTQDIQKKIAAGIILLGAIALTMITCFLILAPFIPWAELINVSGTLASNETAPTIAVVVIFFSLSTLAGIVFKVQMGLQLGFSANIWMTMTSILGLITVLSVIYLGGGLPFLAAATVSPPVIIGILASILFWGVQKPIYRPRFSGLTVKDIKSLAGTSGLFFILQISGLVAFQSDNLILAYYLGPESVALYAVAFKLFTLPSIILSLFLNALWPAYAEAKSRGDRVWIYRTFLKSINYSIIITVPISIILLLAGRQLIDLWVGPSISPTWDLLVGLFIWSLLTILGGNFAALLNGIGVIKFQVITSVSMAVVNIVLSSWLVQIIGISGVIWGSVISLAFILYLPTIIYCRKIFRRELMA